MCISVSHQILFEKGAKRSQTKESSFSYKENLLLVRRENCDTLAAPWRRAKVRVENRKLKRSTGGNSLTLYQTWLATYGKSSAESCLNKSINILNLDYDFFLFFKVSLFFFSSWQLGHSLGVLFFYLSGSLSLPPLPPSLLSMPVSCSSFRSTVAS